LVSFKVFNNAGLHYGGSKITGYRSLNTTLVYDLHVWRINCSLVEVPSV